MEVQGGSGRVRSAFARRIRGGGGTAGGSPRRAPTGSGTRNGRQAGEPRGRHILVTSPSAIAATDATDQTPFHSSHAEPLSSGPMSMDCAALTCPSAHCHSKAHEIRDHPCHRSPHPGPRPVTVMTLRLALLMAFGAPLSVVSRQSLSRLKSRIARGRRRWELRGRRPPCSLDPDHLVYVENPTLPYHPHDNKKASPTSETTV